MLRFYTTYYFIWQWRALLQAGPRSRYPTDLIGKRQRFLCSCVTSRVLHILSVTYRVWMHAVRNPLPIAGNEKQSRNMTIYITSTSTLPPAHNRSLDSMRLTHWLIFAFTYYYATQVKPWSSINKSLHTFCPHAYLSYVKRLLLKNN